MHKTDNMPNPDKVKVELDRDVVNRLIRMKQVGDSYSTIIKRLLDDKDKTKERGKRK
jgi:predicted CopG family antitoxin